MNFLKIGLISAAVLLFVVACAQNSANTATTNTANAAAVVVNSNAATNGEVTAAATDDLAAARKFYSENCVNCHKADGLGGYVDTPTGKIRVPNLTTDRQKDKPDSEYLDVIANGAKEDGMPAFKGKISDEEIKNLVKFVRREFQKP